MNPRSDLLDLTPTALMALANAGFVKRAQKDVAAGLLPTLEIDDAGTLTARYDDGCVTRLPMGVSLREADCSCSATAMCRHRVTLVLAWQAQAATAQVAKEVAPAADEYWSPSSFDLRALAQVLPPTAFEQAERLCAASPLVTVHPWRGAEAPPMAQLPMCSVRFFVRDAIAHARCDCRQGGSCAHLIVAIRAFVLAEQAGALTDARTVQLSPPGAAAADPVRQALHADLDALLLSLWLEGAAQPLLAVAAQLQALRRRVMALGWCWVDDALRELLQLLQARQARSSRYAPQALLVAVAGVWARLHAASALSAQPFPRLPAAQLLGIGVQGSVALDRLRLVALGTALWRDEQYEGAAMLWADPDTQALTVMERQWPLEPERNPPLHERRVAGQPLRQLAASQVLTQGATRSANGQLDITAQRQHTGVLPLSPRAWDELGHPLRQSSPTALARHLETQVPAFAQPRMAAAGVAGEAGGSFHVVQLDDVQVTALGWDPVAQTLHACLRSSADDSPDVPVPLWLYQPYRAVAPAAVDTLARALQGEFGQLRAVAGTVQRHAGQLRMLPLALLTNRQAVVLQVATAGEPVLLPTLRPPQSAAAQALEGVTERLALLLEQGLRHQHSGAWERLQASAQALQLAGMTEAAAQLRGLRAALAPDQRGALLQRLGSLVLMLQGLSQALPVSAHSPMLDPGPVATESA